MSYQSSIQLSASNVDKNGNLLNQSSSYNMLNDFSKIYFMLMDALFLIGCQVLLIGSVQIRKKRFIDKYENSQLKISYESILANFPYGLLVVSKHRHIKFLNEDVALFLNVERSETGSTGLDKQLFYSY